MFLRYTSTDDFCQKRIYWEWHLVTLESLLLPWCLVPHSSDAFKMSLKRTAFFSTHLPALSPQINSRTYTSKRQTFAVDPVPKHPSKTQSPIFVNFSMMGRMKPTGLRSARTVGNQPDAVTGNSGSKTVSENEELWIPESTSISERKNVTYSEAM